MSLLRQLTEKPWEGPAEPALLRGAGPSFRGSAAAVGLGVFLCVVSVLFTLLIVAYAERMAYEDWRPAPRQWLLWLNTAVLAASSAAFAWAAAAAREGRLESARAGLAGAGVLALLFLLGQLWAWRQLAALATNEIAGPAVSFFYLITALHALHLAGGLVVWGHSTLALGRRTPDLAKAAHQMRLCARYWHFLLALWLLLFALLFSGNDHLSTLLAICGLR